MTRANGGVCCCVVASPLRCLLAASIMLCMFITRWVIAMAATDGEEKKNKNRNFPFSPTQIEPHCERARQRWTIKTIRVLTEK